MAFLFGDNSIHKISMSSIELDEILFVNCEDNPRQLLRTSPSNSNRRVTVSTPNIMVSPYFS